MAARFALSSGTIFSVHELASQEADAYKWLKSERVGYDVGPPARQEWFHRYWRCFCRYRWLEHLLGVRRFHEFDDASFGRLSDPIVAQRPTVRFVLKHFTEDGWENLHFFVWGPDCGYSLGELRETLSIVDVNATHFEPPGT